MRATDIAGNTDPTPASFTWTIDTTAPTSTVSFPSAGGFYNAGAWNDPAGTASEAGGGALDKVEISIRRSSTGDYWNGTAFADATENWRPATGTATWSHVFAAVSFPADDDFVVRARATDTAGNVETPLSYSCTYDTAAPQTTIDSSAAPTRRARQAPTSRSPRARAEPSSAQLDGGAFAACTSPKRYTGLRRRARTPSRCARRTPRNTDATPA